MMKILDCLRESHLTEAETTYRRLQQNQSYMGYYIMALHRNEEIRDDANVMMPKQFNRRLR